MNTVSKFGKSFNVVNTELNSRWWLEDYKNWENSTFDFIIPHLDKDKTFIDIGAWIGPISLLTSQLSKQCICFEPDVVAHDEFKQNIELNNIKNIYLENAAVSIHPEIKLGADVLGYSITRDSCNTNVTTYKCFSIKDILDKYNLSEQDISVIKIDIEGHETELLKDKTLWDLNVPMHIAFHPGWKEDKKAFFDSVIPFLEHKNIDVSNLQDLGNFFDLTINKTPIQPRITISLTSFGRPERTKRSIQCILDQDINNWEAFIMGDCCPDFQKLIDSGYLQSIKEEQEKKGNIIHFFNAKEHGGGCGYKLINYAIQHATGKYFIFYSNDDIIFNNHFSNYLEIENTNLDYMFFDTLVDPTDEIRVSRLAICHIGHSEIIVATELAKQLPEHSSVYGHDWEFIDAMSTKGKGEKSKNNILSYRVMHVPMFGTKDKIN